MNIDSEINYCRPPRRLRAVLVDGLIVGLLIYISILLVASLELANSVIESALIVFLPGSIEPLFVSLSGSSIGHHIYGMRVRRTNTDKKLNLLRSYLRFIFKLPLGIVSLATILTSRRHQAIHDFFVGSIVVLKDPANLPNYEALSERIVEKDGYQYPSKLRRVLVIFLYLFSLFILVGLMNVALVSDTCMLTEKCSQQEFVIVWVCGAMFWILLFVIVGLGWQSRLLGCRRDKI